MTTDHRCTFCSKREKEVRKLISKIGTSSKVEAEGPHICDECVGLCLDILTEEGIDIVAERVVRPNRQ